MPLGVNLVALLVPFAFFGTVSWIVYIVIRERTRREAHRVELNSKLLERVGSAREFGEFLGSPAGERFLQSLTVEPRSRTVASVRFGGFAVILGLILWTASFAGQFGQDTANWRIFATIMLALGLASLGSALISHVVASRFDRHDDLPKS
jgi:hypothetical protein